MYVCLQLGLKHVNFKYRNKAQSLNLLPQANDSLPKEASRSSEG